MERNLSIEKKTGSKENCRGDIYAGRDSEVCEKNIWYDGVVDRHKQVSGFEEKFEGKSYVVSKEGSGNIHGFSCV